MHSLGAIDQEWPNGSNKQHSFAGTWHKKVGSGAEQLASSSREFSISVNPGESVLYKADFNDYISFSGTYTINSGTSYSIEPNTEVRFAAGAKLVVNGTLVANGRPDSTIKFVSPTGDYWQGLNSTVMEEARTVLR